MNINENFVGYSIGNKFYDGEYLTASHTVKTENKAEIAYPAIVMSTVFGAVI